MTYLGMNGLIDPGRFILPNCNKMSRQKADKRVAAVVEIPGEMEVERVGRNGG